VLLEVAANYQMELRLLHVHVLYMLLREGDVLTLITDGIVEAQDQRGDMFGFARVSEMLRSGATALDLANAAQSFGQDDDILVLRIKRTVSVDSLMPAVA
jgi:serine phosphatase RsbU (regulator of sigma subunit)